MRKILATAVIVLILGASCLFAQDVLFPEREYIKQHSLLFFKKVNLTFPPIDRVYFHVRSGAYRSAYINLTETMTKNHYLKTVLPKFGERSRDLVLKFNETFREGLRIESYTVALKELKISKLTYQLLVLFSVYDDYMNSRLSGKNAFKMWNVFLRLTEDAYKRKDKTRERAAMLSVASHLVYFKKAKKWQKKSAKMLRKLPADAPGSADTLLVLGEK